MTSNEKTAALLTEMAVALDAQSEHPSFTTVQERLFAGGMRRPKPKRAAAELMPNGDQETVQHAQDLLDRIAGEYMDDYPEFGGFTDFDIVDSTMDEDRLRDVIEDAIQMLEIDRVDCSFCDRPVPAATAHLHQGEWVGDECCFDERLRASE